ncbi:MAG: hypothetical protein AAF293_07145 [Pseudomonadota bacterium]
MIPRLLIAACFLMPAHALAEGCADVGPPLSVREKPLFDNLTATTSQIDGETKARAIWQLWHTAPDPQAQELLDRGVRRIRSADFAEAQRILSDLITYCPDYAEGWNQRAFARFLDGDLEGSLEDLDKTLQLEPKHFAAMAGRGLTLLRQGRELLAHQALRDAVAIYPWLTERRLLPPDQKI